MVKRAISFHPPVDDLSKLPTPPPFYSLAYGEPISITPRLTSPVPTELVP